MNFFEGKKILVTGGAGFLGSNVVKQLVVAGAQQENIIIPRSKDVDLRVWENCLNVTKGIDIVIHLAGIVGGIGFNREYPGTAFYNNAIMGIQLIEAARQNNVKKFVTIGSVCSYPKYASVPFLEENLWDGYPEETNASYGLAKKMMLVQGQAYRQQYDFNIIHLLMVNLYGPGDNFNPASSHVIPALIKKFVDAKEHNTSVEIWGTGKASREFLYVEDAAKAIVLATEKYDSIDPVNIGSGMEVSIKDLVSLISDATEFSGEIIWNNSKPDGQPKRGLDVSKAKKEFGFTANTDFMVGIKNTINWYLQHRV